MKPRKAILTAAAVTALFSAGGCDLNEVQCVYGPPPSDTTPFVARYETSETAEFEPSDNNNENVYGPPPWFETEEYDPEYNNEQCVYGPPPDYYEAEPQTAEPAETAESPEQTEEPATSEDTEEVLVTEETGDITADIFSPEMNFTPDVYGPPEWFE